MKFIARNLFCMQISVGVALWSGVGSVSAKRPPAAASGGAQTAASAGKAAAPQAGQSAPAKAPPQSGVTAAQLIPTLQAAYSTLAKADHDYDGHRIDAMKAISRAAEMLHGKVSGAGHGGETQTLSDLEIRSTQMMLLSVGRSAEVGTRNKDVIKPINEAVEQLNLALASESSGKASGVSGVAAKTVVGGNAPADAVGSSAVEISALNRIYGILAVANHDYGGYRVKAMKAIANASKSLGGTLKGDGRGGEAQTISDEQLQQSKILLGQVQTAYAGSDDSAVKKSLNNAVQHLSKALSIK